MNIIYLISIIVLFIILLLIKKTDKKENFLFWFFLSAVIISCYNIFECYILSLIKIKCSLTVLSLINFIVIAISIFLMLKKDKEIQKYYLNWQDILISILIFLSVMFVMYKRYGINLDLKYESSDPATHYIAAKCFYKNKALLLNVENEDKIYDFGSFMPAAYVNTGIMFDVVSKYMSEGEFYHIYIIFDIIILLIGAELFYFLIAKDEKNNVLRAIGLIFTLLYIFAYPLNSMLFGFAYLSVSLVIIEGIIAIAPLINSQEYDRKYILIMAFLLSFGIFFSYYLFMPIVYTALGLYLLTDIITNRKKISIVSLKNIVTLVVVLIVPTIMGFCYFVLPGLVEGKGTAIQVIDDEGYIYRNLYSNFILIAPLVFYYILDKIKNKENDFINIFMILMILFIIIMLFGILKGKVSTYYFYKLYYAFWILIQISAFKAINKMYYNKEIRMFVYSYVIFLTCIVLYGLIQVDAKFKNKNEYLDTNNLARQICNIYPANQDFIKNTKSYYSDTQMKMFKYCDDNRIFEEKDSFAVCTGNLQQRWLYAMFGVADVKETREFATIIKTFDIEKWLKENKKYYIYIGEVDSQKIKNDETDYKILYQEKDCLVLERK